MIILVLLSGCSEQLGQSVQTVTQAVTQSNVDSSTSTSDQVSFLDSESIFTQADSMLSSAKQSVLLEMYELGNPSELKLLEADADKGIPVLLLLDPKEPQSQMSVVELKAHNVSVIMAKGPLIGGNGIQHAKMLIVDDTQVLIGGMNWGKGSYKNADADVFLTGQLAKNAQAVFVKDWEAVGGHIPQSVVNERTTGSSILSGQPLLKEILLTLDNSSLIQASLFEISNYHYSVT